MFVDFLCILHTNSINCVCMSAIINSRSVRMGDDIRTQKKSHVMDWSDSNKWFSIVYTQFDDSTLYSRTKN